MADTDMYIPVGCLRITRDTCPEIAWDRDELISWVPLATYEEREGATVLCLDLDSQRAILRVTRLRPLLEAQWIRLEFKVTNNLGILRVHLLPDDVLRGSIDRANWNLNKNRQVLMRKVDVSKALWDGNDDGSSRQPMDLNSDDEAKTAGGMSLLRLFNQMASPRPDINKIATDDFARDAMDSVLQGKVKGLSTDLYPYQRRSAALMLQKEVSPEIVQDPRLTLKKAQDGSLWYFDHIVGTVLRDPRSYEGVAGGILAEEMGAGKTIICLALVMATKDLPTIPPSLYGIASGPSRRKVASLADMAASCANRHAVPWRQYLDIYGTQLGMEFKQCAKALERNPGFYMIPGKEPRRVGRHASALNIGPPTKVTLSSTTLVIVPNNLLSQWRQEIQKHTSELQYLAFKGKEQLPDVDTLVKMDILLFAQSRFERIVTNESWQTDCPLMKIHFKRCIVDEGHRLGNSKMYAKSVLLTVLDKIHASSRWIVTGTPSQGLFGIDMAPGLAKVEVSTGTHTDQENGDSLALTSIQMEKKDIERIGAMTSQYLKARPWANNWLESGDTPAEWGRYLMLAKHSSKGRGRWENLKATLETLIIRHQLGDVGDLLPPVEEKLVVLDGSYQDQLSLNIFSMMIIFNSVQSQRTDMDYFFHSKQNKSLLQIVHNLKQTSFFGGSFFTSDEIEKSVGTAEKFLEERKVPISSEDEELLRAAIHFGHVAMTNQLRNFSNIYHEVPVYVREFPARAGPSWSLGGQSPSDDVACTSASHLLALQKLVYSSLKNPEQFNALLNGGLASEGQLERDKFHSEQRDTQGDQERPPPPSRTLAGNTKLGDDSPRKNRFHGLNGLKGRKLDVEAFEGPLEQTRITSTVSAKLSYLIDGIVKHQEDEKILIFYENENVAWYLASLLDVLQIQHLIYAKGLTVDRRAQYVNTFHHNDKFRVLLMDLSQAAFGLDIKIASRIYFINPVLNPQVEAQAVGRVRRISQTKPVSVETLVLRDSIDEVLLERKQHMTQAEHRRMKSILDIRPLYNWMKNPRLVPMAEVEQGDIEGQMIALKTPQYIFGREFGKELHPDDGIILDEPMGNGVVAGPSSSRVATPPSQGLANVANGFKGLKRPFGVVNGDAEAGPSTKGDAGPSTNGDAGPSVTGDSEPPKRRVRFAG